MNKKTLNKTIINIIIISIIVLLVVVTVKIITTGPDVIKEDKFLLIGSDVTIKYKEDYIEPGYTYIDKNNNDLTKEVQVINNINSKVPGNYKVIYRYNNKMLTRNVTVLPPDSYNLEINYTLSTKELTNKSVDITYSITGNSFYRVELPDGTMTDKKEGKITITKNGTYIIKAYNEIYQTFQKEIVINNIIKEKPTGTCTLTLYDSGGEIVVNSDNTDIIKGYKYYYGKNKTEIIESNKYVTNTMNKNAGVTIYDKAGNYNNITCNTVDKRTPKPTATPKPTKTPKPSSSQNGSVTSYDSRSYTTETYNGVRYALYKPSNSVSGKIPLVLYFVGSAGLNVGLPTYLNSGSNYPYYIAIPIDSKDSSFAASLIDHLASNLSIDTKRVYVSGASSGTKPALITGYQYSDKFAGAIIIASYSDTPNYNIDKPMWFFQGTSDSYKMVENIVNSINNSGGNAKLTPYDGGHDAPLVAFGRSDLTSWILK